MQLALGRDAADDPGARRAVPAEVALLVGRRDRVAVLVDRDRDRLVDLADERMVRLDAAVEDADANALAGRALERPLARDALGPLEVEPDRSVDPGGSDHAGSALSSCYARFCASLSRCAMIWSIFHAIDAFVSTSGRKSHDVMP